MTVSVGQVWGDKDRRRLGRTFEVQSIDADANLAKCKIVTAGLSRGKESFKINLNRFVPKYYFLKQPTKPVVTKSHLAQRCSDLMAGDWKPDKPGYALLKHDEVELLVREVSDTTFDVKIRIDECLVQTFVNRNSLEDTFERIQFEMERLHSLINEFLG